MPDDLPTATACGVTDPTTLAAIGTLAAAALDQFDALRDDDVLSHLADDIHLQAQVDDWISDDDLDRAMDEAFIDDITAEVWEVLDDSAQLRIRLMITRAGLRNSNGRIYPKHVLTDAVTRFKRKLLRKKAIMQLEHPPIVWKGQEPVGFREDKALAVAMIDDAFMDADGRLLFDVTFLDTVHGRDLADKHKLGGRLNVSFRSLGSSRRCLVNGKPTRVATFVDMFGGDFVKSPAMPEAGPIEVLTDSDLNDAITAEEAAPMTPQQIAKMQADVKDLQGQVAAIGTPSAMTDSANVAAFADLNQKIGKLQGILDDEAMEDAANKAKGNPFAKKDEDDEAGKKKAADDKVMKDSLADLTRTVATLAESHRTAEAAVTASANRTAVAAFTDSLKTTDGLARFPDAVKVIILDRVSKAPDKDTADKVLLDSCEAMDVALATAAAAARGYTGTGTSERGTTTGTAVGGRVAEVTANPQPWMPILDNFAKAFDDQRMRENKPGIDKELRTINQPFIDNVLRGYTENPRNAKALTDSANAWAAQDSAMLDSTDTGDLLNQPIVLTALMVQQFWQMTGLQYVGGIGPNGFTDMPDHNGKLGTVLRIPVEYPILPTGTNLPFNDPGMFSAEDAEIPEMGLADVWLTFTARFRRLGFSLTAEAEQAMKNGPLDYNAWARLTAALTANHARTMDAAINEEQLLIAAEYGAVAVVSEVVNTAEFTYAGGGSAGGYGTNVLGVAQLLCGGTTGSPNTAVPVVRPRWSQNMNADGTLAAVVIANAVTVTGHSFTQVLGYLDENGEIQNIPGQGTATFAVDYENGKVVFNSTSTITSSFLPTVTYKYETNYDTFQVLNVTLPIGVSYEDYLNGLLRQIDSTAAGMGSNPRYMIPDLARCSLNVSANYITGASNFYKWQSPDGTRLTDPNIAGKAKFAERNGLEFAKHNQPWTAGDSRILLTRARSTKYAIEKPFGLQGPFQKYGANRGLIAAKMAYGEEKSLICTPQTQDQSGNVLNPVGRSIRLT